MAANQTNIDAGITIRCSACGGDNVPLPRIQAPEGYAFDASKVLLTCRDCGAMADLNQFAHKES